MNTLPKIHLAWPLRDVIYRCLDVLAIAGGAAVAVKLTAAAPSDRHFAAVAAGIIVYYLVAQASGAYRSWRGVSAEREVVSALVSWVIAMPLVVTLGFLIGHTEGFPRWFMGWWGLATACLLVLGRVALRETLRWARARGYNSRRYAIVGINQLSLDLAGNVERAPELGLKLVGFYDDRPPQRLPPLPADIGCQVGNIADLVVHSRNHQVDTIYITFPMRAEGRIKSILEQLSDTTASVYIVPDFFVFELLHSRWTSINGLPAVSVFENPFYGVDGLIKRTLDLVLATGMLLALGLPMLGIAAAVKITSPGPVFFRQKRYGLDGREIRVWKFRSMRVCEDGGAVKQATKQDSRITPLGAILRKTSLDELPQLFNVLQGSMSLVGPRPHANVHNEEYRTLIRGYMLRHKVKPGITGLAQVSGYRGETDTLSKMEKRIECDHRYIREWSLWMDLKILFKTFWVVLSRQNAY